MKYYNKYKKFKIWWVIVLMFNYWVFFSFKMGYILEKALNMRTFMLKMDFLLIIWYYKYGELKWQRKILEKEKKLMKKKILN